MSVEPIILNQLNIDPLKHKVISIVGAGGKTSMMNRLRKELTGEGYRVIVTTSTHIAREPGEPFAENGDAEEIQRLIEKHGYAVTGTYEPSRNGRRMKLSSIGEDKLIELRRLCDVMLIEADGARRQFIKVPADWEPVIYPWTDLVIGITSAISIGRKIEDVAYRPEDLAAFLGKQTSDEIDTADIAKIATSESGLRKHVEGKDYRFYLNAIDDLHLDSDAGCRVSQDEIESLANYLRQDFGIDAHFGSLQHLDKD